MTKNLIALLATFLATAACKATPPSPPLPGAPDSGTTTGPADASPDVADAAGEEDSTACSEVFTQERLPNYYVEMSDADLAALRNELINCDGDGSVDQPSLVECWRAREDEVPPRRRTPYFPLTSFRFQGFPVVSDAMIRLKGRSSWRHAVDKWRAGEEPFPKMQFVISFNENDPKGRFEGLRKIELDMPRNDRSFLRHRMALHYLRDLGIPAQCANNAKLFINGNYYGLFTAVERLDKEFIQRNFGKEDDEGDLWKGGRDLKTNEETSDRLRRDRLFSASTLAEVEALSDLDAAITEWAAEAMMPDADGYYGGTHNYYLYDHPTRGFVWLPHDKDTTFDYRPASISPQFWDREDQPNDPYLFVMEDADRLAQFEQALATARTGYDVPLLQQRIDDWSAQIEIAAETDPNRPFSVERYREQRAELRAYLPLRAAFIDSWLSCRADGGVDTDGDGTIWCFDCDDSDNTVGPHATETCELSQDEAPIDDNCNGRIDEGLTCP